MSWLREFESVVEVDGEFLSTLLEAGEYIAALPNEVSAQTHWQAALRAILMAAEHGGDLRLAEATMRSAVLHGQRVNDTRRKQDKVPKIIH